MKLIKYTFLAIALFCFAFSGLNAQSNSEKGDVNIQVINLDNGQTVDKPLIGIMLSIEHEIEELNGQRKESSTLMVDGFVENGFAEKSGLQVGDVVKTVNGSEVNDYDDLGNALSGKKAGESVAVGVLRNGENLNYSVQLMSRPAQLAAKSSCSYDANSRGKCCPGTKWECDWDEVCEMPGRAVMGVIIEDTEAGVFVKDLSEGGAAQSAGVHAGDVIVRFNKEDIETTDGLIGIMKNYKVGDEVKIKYLRDGKKKSAKMVLKESKSKNRANCDMSKCDMSKCPSKNADTVDEKYDLICEKDNIKVVKLREGDVEKLVKGEEINLRLPGKSTGDEPQNLSIQLAEGVTIDCPKFNIIIGNLDSEEEAIADKNDAAVEMSKMRELSVINLNLYPNPNEGRFELEFGLDNNDPVQIRIVGIDGQEVYSEQTEEIYGKYRNQVDLRDKPAGVYVLQIIQEDKMLTRKIVIE